MSGDVLILCLGLVRINHQGWDLLLQEVASMLLSTLRPSLVLLLGHEAVGIEQLLLHAELVVAIWGGS